MVLELLGELGTEMQKFLKAVAVVCRGQRWSQAGRAKSFSRMCCRVAAIPSSRPTWIAACDFGKPHDAAALTKIARLHGFPC